MTAEPALALPTTLLAAPATAGPPVAREPCPYKGLVPFAESDADLFFGRENEYEILKANLLASRLTVVYGASGVGKTSVLRAGLIHGLREEERARRAAGEPAECLLVTFASWRDDPVLALELCIAEAARAVLGEQAPSFPPARGLAAWMRGVVEATQLEPLIVLDQFEDLFLYHPGEAGPGSFVDEFARVVNDEQLPANFLVALREDAVARLDVFKGRLPGVLRNTLRIRHLDEKGARSAIRRPVDRWNETHAGDAVAIEPGLVEGVIQQVRTGRVIVGESGRGGLPSQEGEDPEVRVEAPYLQLVLERIWAEEARAGSCTLRSDTLDRLGGAEAIVRDHLRSALSALTPAEQGLAAAAFRYLVTPSGGKIALSLADLAANLDGREAELAPVLSKLEASEARILRQVPPPPGEPAEKVRYEIFHDVLGKSIAAWRVWFDQQRIRAEAEQRTRRERRRVRRMAQLLLAMALLAAGLGVAVRAAWQAKRTAQRESARATEAWAVADLRALSQSALAALDADPQLGLLLAIRGASDSRAEQVPELAGALRRSIAASHARRPMLDVHGTIAAAAYHPGRGLVATSTEEGEIAIWSARSGDLVARVVERRIGPPSEENAQLVSRALAFDRGGEHLAAGADGGGVRVWSVGAEGAPTFAREVSKTEITALAFSPGEDSARSLAIGDRAGHVLLWELGSAEAPRSLGAIDGPDAGVASLDFSRDGGWVATGHEDGAVRLWGTAPDGPRTPRGCPTPCELRDPEVRINHVKAVAFSPDGRKIATGNWDAKVRLYDLDAPADRRVRTIGRHANTVFSVAFSPDGRRIASASADGSARLWGVATRVRLATFMGHTQPVSMVSFDEDGDSVLTAGWDGTVRTWDARSHDDEVTVVAAAPHAPLLATGSRDGVVKVWNLETGFLLSGEAHDARVTAMELSQDGTRLATLGDDGEVKVWDTSSGECVFRQAFEREVSSIALSWDGTRLAQGNDDGSAWLWDLDDRSSKPLKVLELKTPVQMKVRFAPDDHLLVYAAGLAALYDCRERGRCTTQQKKLVQLAPSVVADAAFSSRGVLATVSIDGRLRLYDPRTLALLWESEQHLQVLTSLAFSGDGSRVAYAGWDRMVHVMDVAARKVVLAVPYPQGLEGVSLGSDGSWLAVVGSMQGGFPDVYPVGDADALAAAREGRVRELTDHECGRYLGHLPCAPPDSAAPAETVALQRAR